MMDNIDQLLKRFFSALEQHTADEIDEETIAQILRKEFDGSEREMLITVLDSLFGEVTKMAENPKDYFFSNEQEKLDKYLDEKDRKVDPAD
jgi:hypothetical protein